jgi:N-methylhydantoinase B
MKANVMESGAHLDPVTVAVVRNYYLSAARQMRNVLMRASFNPVIYEMIDFGLGLYNARAELLAEGPAIPHFLGTLRFAIGHVVDYVGRENVADGDVFISTYPYWTGSHSQDVVIIRPIFVTGRIFGYAAVKAHWMDIGANDIYGTSTVDIWQEGLQMFGARVRVAGVMNREVVEIIRANSRLPDSAIGDLNAQIAACDMGARRVLELVEKYGAHTVDTCCDAFLDHGEQITRHAIAAAPDGEWTASGFLDDDGLSDEPVPIHVRVKIAGDELTIDTTGSAGPQVGPINAPFPATVSFARLAMKRLMLPSYEANEGCFRPLNLIVPQGSILNADPPAPAFLYAFGPYVMGDLIMEALAEAMPQRAVARAGGNECARLFSGADERYGGYFAGADIDGSGQGASLDGDGESALIVYYGGDSRNIPIEVTESKYPIRTLEFALRQDSGGAGRHRGGLGIVKSWRALADLRFITTVEQTKFPAQGVRGGGAGQPAEIIANIGTERETRRGKASDLLVPARAELHLRSGGGGGWGAACERPVDIVLDDVQQGYVSAARAEADYAVAVEKRDGAWVVDEARTRMLRAGACF